MSEINITGVWSKLEESLCKYSMLEKYLIRLGEHKNISIRDLPWDAELYEIWLYFTKYDHKNLDKKFRSV